MFVDTMEKDLTCGRCGENLYKRHCKICCPQCGVIRDCSDPF